MAAKRPGVPNITGETGYQPAWAPDGAWRYDEFTGLGLTQRKWALGFAAGSTGATQWDWDREVDFGMKRRFVGYLVWGLEERRPSLEQGQTLRPGSQIELPGSDGDATLITSYKLGVVPATYLIDKQGRIVANYSGVIDKSDVDSNINKLLAEQ